MKRKNKINFNYINKKSENILYLIIAFIISSFSIDLSYGNKLIIRKLDLNNEITMTIKGTGEQYIVREDSEIYQVKFMLMEKSKIQQVKQFI